MWSGKHLYCRKNYGCTHFWLEPCWYGIYREYDAQKLCIKYESELGIKIVKVRGPFLQEL